MIETLYIEEEIRVHPRVQTIEKQFPQARKIFCKNFSEIFNRTHQSFFLQKEKPSLILAKKNHSFFQEAEKNHGASPFKHFYFSPLFNCPFRCHYCFLQGFFRSAHYVLFVNFEDFQREIEQLKKTFPQEKLFFFCGYHGDSLALENVFSIVDEFFPFFERNKEILFELRTKSVSIETLCKRNSIENCIIAWSLNPQKIISSLEERTPSLALRLNALKTLQELGWKIALRFDPVIAHKDFEKTYAEFFQNVFSEISLPYSVTLGSARFPKPFYQNQIKWGFFPLLASLSEKPSGVFSHEQEETLLHFCQEEILRYIPKELLYIQRKGF